MEDTHVKRTSLSSMESVWVSLPKQSSDGLESLADRVRRVEADLDEINTFYNISISPTRRQRLSRFYHEELHSLLQIDFDSLNQQDRVDFILLRNFLKQQKSQLNAEIDADKDLEPMLSFAATIMSLCEHREHVKPIQPEHIANKLNDVKNLVEEAHQNVDNGKMKVSKTAAYKASKVVAELRNHLAEMYRFYSSYDAQFDWWATTPWKAAHSALSKYIPLIQTKLAGMKPDGSGDIIGQPIGREGLLDELEAEVIAYAPEELIQIAHEQFKWCEQQMKAASTELGFSNDWKKALEYVKTRFVPPGEQPQLVMHLAREGANFVRDNELVTIPPLAEETYRTVMMPAEQQKVSPFFLGGPMIQIAYPTNDMTYDLKNMVMRGNNRHFSRATVFHELIPGHRLQIYQAQRHRSHRLLFSTPFFVEGWAMYWEFVLWQRGDFFVSPEDRIGTMFWRMHRCARIILTMNFHLGKMEPQECIDVLVNQVGHERSTAEGEVRRWLNGDYGPLYQIAYMIGALQLVDLRKEVLKSGKMTEKGFHDRILTYGPIPNELVRALVLEKDLKPDYKAQWRFYK
ncbi:hypothetical protein QQS21_008643 [Conoideocrella luteorostrata]|uniref:X-Pro dipeptidyl-peptidase n=1 Tax=Conoideocrella luteorostrata TaxID=1105319 RepID=A0AAJ0FVS8_9HYPO|nr:hypothetical protein QQS21_008643 [Conoideocrella luteorostrata]